LGGKGVKVRDNLQIKGLSNRNFLGEEGRGRSVTVEQIENTRRREMIKNIDLTS